jgi:hypothetical protein
MKSNKLDEVRQGRMKSSLREGAKNPGATLAWSIAPGGQKTFYSIRL